MPLPYHAQRNKPVFAPYQNRHATPVHVFGKWRDRLYWALISVLFNASFALLVIDGALDAFMRMVTP